MKFTVSFKTPDAVNRELSRAIVNMTPAELLKEDREKPPPEDQRDAEWLEDQRIRVNIDVSEKLEAFVEHGEYIRIEFDTAANTATVLPTGKGPAATNEKAKPR